MNDKQYDSLFGDEDTKEVIDLTKLEENDITKKTMDQNMEESDLQFQEEVEALNMGDDTVIVENNEQKEKKPKEKKKGKLKEKWQNLSKRTKIIIIVSSVIVVILIGVLLFFCLRKKDEKPVDNIPDVILEEDNYRYENGTLYFLDEDENDIGSYECENKDENTCYVAYLSNNDDFDGLIKMNDDEEIVEERSKIYDNRYVFVYDNKKEKDGNIKLYDIKESSVVKELLEVKAYENHDEYVVLKDVDNKMGLTELSEDGINEIISYRYDFLGILPTDKKLDQIVAKEDGKYYLINKDNERLTTGLDDKIVGANSVAVKTKSNTNNYSVYDYQGKLVDEGDYAYLLDNYVAFVKDFKLYITDYKNHPMNLEGINLKTDYYNPVAIYKKNKLSKTNKSFEIEINDQTAIVRIYDEDENSESKTLDLKDGILSSNLAYITYLDGRLYIYKDNEKKELIGTYVCSNKNSIDNNTKELNNCKIAEETFLGETRGNAKEVDKTSLLGTIPIFNSRYAFIKDGNAIILYDLTESTSKAWYTEVDTTSYTNTKDITFVDKDNVYYIGKSERSGNYGLAKITKSNVEVQIPFEYGSLKRIGDYYSVKKDDEYFLVDLGGKTLTNAMKHPIVDYHRNYVKTLGDDGYRYSRFDDNEINENFEYIELYDEYYAAVYKDKDNKDQRKLRVYMYGVEEPIIDNIELHLNNYNGEGTKAFIVEINGNNMTIQIGESDNTYNKSSYNISSLKNEAFKCKKVGDKYYNDKGLEVNEEEYKKTCVKDSDKVEENTENNN